MKRSTLGQCILFAVVFFGLPWATPAGVVLTSATLDPEDASGQTTNAPGAWSTNTGDPLTPLAFSSGGTFLNTPGAGFDLGEISIPMNPGLNTYQLFANQQVPSNLFYGLILFFDGPANPQIAVYNSNGGVGPFQVQSAGTQVIGSASGGSFFNPAPGSALYTAPDGSTVEVIAFTVNSTTPLVDTIGPATIGPDGRFDTTADLTLRYNPAVPEPATGALMLLGVLAVSGFGLGSKRR